MSDFEEDKKFGKKGEEYFLQYAHDGIFYNCSTLDSLKIEDLRSLHIESEFRDSEGRLYEVKSASDVYRWGTVMLELYDEYNQKGWFTEENAVRIDYLVYVLFRDRDAPKPYEVIAIDFFGLWTAVQRGTITGNLKSSYSHGKKWICLSVRLQSILEYVDSYRFVVLSDNDQKAFMEFLHNLLISNPEEMEKLRTHLKKNDLIINQIGWHEGTTEIHLPRET